MLILYLVMGCLRGGFAPSSLKIFPLSKSGEGDKGGEVAYDYDIIKLSLIMEANYWKH
jgi:hypothetical protein